MRARVDDCHSRSFLDFAQTLTATQIPLTTIEPFATIPVSPRTRNRGIILRNRHCNANPRRPYRVWRDVLLATFF